MRIQPIGANDLDLKWIFVFVSERQVRINLASNALNGKFKAFRDIRESARKWVYFLHDQHLSILGEELKNIQSHRVFRQSFRGEQFCTAILWNHFSEFYLFVDWLLAHFIVQVKLNKSITMQRKWTKNDCVFFVKRIDYRAAANVIIIINIIQMPFILAAEKKRVFKCIVCTSMAFRNSKSYSYRAAHLSCSYVICQYFRLCRQISAHRKFYRAHPAAHPTAPLSRA